MQNNILNVFSKEIKQVRRDRRLLPIIIVLPIIQLLLLSYAANLDIRNIPFAVLDRENSFLSRGLIESFSQSGYFDLQTYLQSYNEIEEMIESEHIKMALVIDSGFIQKLEKKHQAPLQVILDGSDGFQAGVALNYASAIVQRFATKILQKNINFSIFAIGGDITELVGQGEGNLIDSRTRLWYNPELKSRYFMVPGVIVIILMVLTMILTSVSIVREKELGTMEHLIVTPLKRRDLIIGKLLPFVFIGFIDVAVIITIAILWFKLPFKGSFALLALGAGLFLLSTLSLGLLVSIISKTQHQAMMTGFFLALPFMLLSGFIFPIANMPQWVQYLTYAIPPRYFLTIIRGIFLKGVGFSILWPQFVMLFALGFGILLFSVLSFRKSL
jgi:ABC-2 type transport system permease protein